MFFDTHLRNVYSLAELNERFSASMEKKLPLILDGAMGTLLSESGYLPDKSQWFSHVPLEVVYAVHNRYVEAGADIITTNTFRTNPHAFGFRRDIERKNLLKDMVLAARSSATKGDRVIVAGSNAPLGDCYQVQKDISTEEYFLNHETHIRELKEQGVDCILNETFGNWNEIETVAEICRSVHIPWIISIFVQENGKLLSGEHAAQVITKLAEYQPLAVSVNCVPPKTLEPLLPVLSKCIRYGFYCNCGGSPEQSKGSMQCTLKAEEYLAFIQEVMKQYDTEPPSFIGSCCLSSPAHTRILTEYFQQ